MKKIVRNIKWWFRRKGQQIKALIRYVPVIWKSRDFDYHYSIDLFQMKLEDLADFMESGKTFAFGAKMRAQRIRMVLRLMKKVYDEEYGCEYQELNRKEFGEPKFEFKELEEKDKNGDPYWEMVVTYDGKELTEEQENISSERFLASQEKQKKAHRILWELIEHNIQDWWD